jgi:hypothetical protein
LQNPKKQPSFLLAKSIDAGSAAEGMVILEILSYAEFVSENWPITARFPGLQSLHGINI